MGNGHSRAPPRHDFNGPLFGGHYPGDFSIRNNRPDYNKPLPPVPESKSVRFGADPPAWEFYRHRPSDENTANTRYCNPQSLSPEQSQPPRISPPPAYGAWYDGKGMTVRNQ
ncbi:hypothetical protein IAT38_007878 [Cryptococcus sp. DSM 104549]